MDLTVFAALAIPLISALIGWGTNYIAVKMLFHPRRPVTVLGITFQGILPRRQAAIAVQLGRIVATDLLSSEQLVSCLTSPASHETYRDFIDREAEKFIEEKLYREIPLSRLFLRSKTIARLKQTLTDDLIENLPGLIARLTEPESGSLDIQQLVEEQVLAFSADQLEKILYDMLAKEFRFIEVLGAVIGFLVGVVQLGLVFVWMAN